MGVCSGFDVISMSSLGAWSGGTSTVGLVGNTG